MAKGYIIARIDVTDAETYAKYVAETPRLAGAFGGRFLVRGGRCEAREGEGRSRNVVIEFPSYEKALAFYDSEGYQAILPFAFEGSDRELIIVEGVE